MKKNQHRQECPCHLAPEAAQKELSFSGGVLTLTCAFAKSPDGRFAHGEIAECLLKGL